MLHARPFSASLGLAVALCVSASATPLSPVAARPTRAAPEIIIVYGSLLPERRVIADWNENQAIMLSLGSRRPGPAWLSVRPEGRPALELALFWGHQWRIVAQSPERLRALRPEEGSQVGTFYPATGSTPALLAFGSDVRIVSDSGLAVMRRHGVPTRVP
jgi:hypothetical protein